MSLDQVVDMKIWHTDHQENSINLFLCDVVGKYHKLSISCNDGRLSVLLDGAFLRICEPQMEQIVEAKRGEKRKLRCDDDGSKRLKRSFDN